MAHEVWSELLIIAVVLHVNFVFIQSQEGARHLLYINSELINAACIKSASCVSVISFRICVVFRVFSSVDLTVRMGAEWLLHEVDGLTALLSRRLFSIQCRWKFTILQY